jgi:hypothetical protein
MGDICPPLLYSSIAIITVTITFFCIYTTTKQLKKESLMMTGNIFPLPRMGQHIILHILPDKY